MEHGKGRVESMAVKKSNKLDIKKLTAEAKEIRRLVFKMILAAHASHIASSYSCVELLTYLYLRELHIDPKNPSDPDRDRFILSKGWGVSALYAILFRKGFFGKDFIDQYCKDGSKMIGIATRNGIPGIEATTGSMGHGLPIGVGMAKALKLQDKKSRVYVIIGDGELDEGSTWEGTLLAAHHKLDNFIVFIDYNKWQSFGRTNEILNQESIKEKFKAFNWNVEEINGHDFVEIDKAVKACKKIDGRPSIIIAHTIKGRGLSAIEDKNEWHYQTPRENEIEIAKKEGLA